MSGTATPVIAFLSFVTSFVAAGFLTRIQFLPDRPNQRSMHTRVTPRSGGLALSLPFLMILTYLSWRDGISAHVFGILIGACLFSLLGLVDDAVQLRASTRLVFQVAAAYLLCVYAAPDSVSILDLIVLSGPPATLFQTLWIVCTINFFNFMDGMDGLAGLQAFWFTFVSGLTIVLTAADSLTLGRSLLCLSASLLGFLLWNLRPSTLFMGDSGSYFLGFLIGFLPLVWGHPLPHGPVIQWTPRSVASGLDFTFGLILFAPFLIDALLTVMRRLAERTNVFVAHRTHLYQLLRAEGWSVRQVLVLYQSGNLLCTAVVLMREHWPVSADYFAAGFVLACLAAAIIYSAVTRRLLLKTASAEASSRSS